MEKEKINRDLNMAKKIVLLYIKGIELSLLSIVLEIILPVSKVS